MWHIPRAKLWSWSIKDSNFSSLVSLDLSFIYFFHPQTKLSIILCYLFSPLDIIVADAWVANIFKEIFSNQRVWKWFVNWNGFFIVPPMDKTTMKKEKKISYLNCFYLRKNGPLHFRPWRIQGWCESWDCFPVTCRGLLCNGTELYSNATSISKEYSIGGHATWNQIWNMMQSSFFSIWHFFHL